MPHFLSFCLRMQNHKALSISIQQLQLLHNPYTSPVQPVHNPYRGIVTMQGKLQAGGTQPALPKGLVDPRVPEGPRVTCQLCAGGC